jgi:hypothetical protein
MNILSIIFCSVLQWQLNASAQNDTCHFSLQLTSLNQSHGSFQAESETNGSHIVTNYT